MQKDTEKSVSPTHPLALHFPSSAAASRTSFLHVLPEIFYVCEEQSFLGFVNTYMAAKSNPHSEKR